MKLLTKVYKIIIFKLKKKINLDKKKIKLKKLDNIFNYFGTDKGSKVPNPYSKKNINKEYLGHGFSKYYEKHFKNLKDKKINVLEIGVWKGASTASFFYYLSKANFFVIDRNFKFNYYSKRINFIYCDTSSDKDLAKIKYYIQNKNISSFDIIIDDGSHILSNILKNFIFFFNFLKSGGIYIIEDYKHPNYFFYLNDLKNHFYVDKVLYFLKKKIIFRSTIIKRMQIKYLISNIKKIFTYKGIYRIKNKNISDIAFIYKK
jgi:hypothetical protein